MHVLVAGHEVQMHARRFVATQHLERGGAKPRADQGDENGYTERASIYGPRGHHHAQ